MGHINRKHRDLTALQITTVMRQQFVILDCDCGHHCAGRTGLSLHSTTCRVARLDDPIRYPPALDDPVALPPAVPAAVQLDLASYEELLCRFRQGVFKVHYSWKAPSAAIVEDLLLKTLSETEDTADLNIAALHLFPGLLSFHINKKRGENLLSPIQWLRAILASPDYAVEIIRFARAEAAKPRRPYDPSPAWAPPRMESLRARTVKLMGNGRIRAASHTIDTIAGILEGKVHSEPLSGAALQQRIDLLHPNSNAMDFLPPSDEDPQADSLQVTPDQLRQHLYGMDKRPPLRPLQ